MSPVIPKPAFLIIGAAKCGTTSLADAFDRHPDCCFSRPKEASFFQDTLHYKENPNFARGWNWYQQFFKHYNGESVVGEGTPSYTDRSRSGLTARRVYEFNPAMKLIYMVREPLARQVSAWKMFYHFAVQEMLHGVVECDWAKEGFIHWMERNRAVSQWDECRYGYQLAAYREYFPEEQIAVGFLEDWKHAEAAEIARMMQFVGLDPSACSLDEASVASNTQEQRLYTAAWLRSLQKSPIYGVGRRLLPSGLRSLVFRKVGSKRHQTPAVDYSHPVVAEFLDYVREDNAAFLAAFGKPVDFWKPKIMAKAS